MKIKDIILIALVSLGLFPIVLIITMYATGFMKISIGWEDTEKRDDDVSKITYSPYQESLAVYHSKSFKALKVQRQELEEKRKRIEEDEERLKKLKKDINRKTDDLKKTKARLEELVEKSSELEERRIKQLASVYESMRAEKAAPILFTLKDPLVVKILRKIRDDRQKAKIMAAMGNISKDRTGKISRMMSDIKVN